MEHHYLLLTLMYDIGADDLPSDEQYSPGERSLLGLFQTSQFSRPFESFCS